MDDKSRKYLQMWLPPFLCRRLHRRCWESSVGVMDLYDWYCPICKSVWIDKRRIKVR